MDATAVIALIGGIALLIALVGGGIEADKVRIPAIPYTLRITSGLIGFVLIGIAVWLSSPSLAGLPSTPIPIPTSQLATVTRQPSTLGQPTSTLQQLTPDVQLTATTEPTPTPNLRLSGIIVFASEAPGVETIYIMKPDGSDLAALTSGTMPSWSPDGKQIVFRRNDQIFVINADGSDMRQVSHEPLKAEEPDFSNDGTKIAYCGYGSDGNPDIYVTGVDSYNPVQLTSDSWNCSPDWSPDGTQIVFDRYIDSSGLIEIYVVESDGQNLKRLTTFETYGTVHPAWSPDGTQIAFVAGDLVVMDADGSNIRNFNTQLQAWSPTWSPDGQYIIFNAESSAGNLELFIIPSDGSGELIQITSILGANNMWADWSR